LLIDAILNNFAAYKRQPLYVDLDQYLMRGHPVEDLLTCGGYIVKTHFPQILGPSSEAQVRAVADKAIVLTPVRSRKDICRSATAFGTSMGDSDFVRFAEFWKHYDPVQVPFSALTSHAGYETLLENIAERIGMPPNPNRVLPFSKKDRSRVYFVKALTRLLGHHSPVVNTTI